MSGDNATATWDSRFQTVRVRAASHTKDTRSTPRVQFAKLRTAADQARLDSEGAALVTRVSIRVAAEFGLMFLEASSTRRYFAISPGWKCQTIFAYALRFTSEEFTTAYASFAST